jgi:beta-phosphoglucomutase
MRVKKGPRRFDELGVIFDMDGVLIASTPFHSQAFSEILKPLGIENFLYSRFAGWKTQDVFRTVFLEARMAMGEDKIAECSQRKSARSRELLEQQTQLYRDCACVVMQLAANYPLALASSGSRGSVEIFLEKSCLHDAFLTIVTGDDVSRAKPDPQIFSRAITGLKLAPDRCVVVEDAVAGIEAACAAGAIACGFGPDPDGLLRHAGATCLVESLNELPALLEGFVKA